MKHKTTPRKKENKQKTVELSKQETQEREMIAQYGRQTNHASVCVYMTAVEIAKLFGERCSDHEPFCALCEIWAEWQKTGKVTFDISRKTALALIEDTAD